MVRGETLLITLTTIPVENILEVHITPDDALIVRNIYIDSLTVKFNQVYLFEVSITIRHLAV